LGLPKPASVQQLEHKGFLFCKIMFKPFKEENIFDQIMSDVVAKDDDNNFELISSRGRSKSGSGHKYYIRGGNFGKEKRCPSVKAFSISEAIKKANRFIYEHTSGNNRGGGNKTS